MPETTQHAPMHAPTTNTAHPPSLLTSTVLAVARHAQRRTIGGALNGYTARHAESQSTAARVGCTKGAGKWSRDIVQACCNLPQSRATCSVPPTCAHHNPKPAPTQALHPCHSRLDTVSATELASLVMVVAPRSVRPANTSMARASLPVSLLLTVSAAQSPLLSTVVCAGGGGGAARLQQGHQLQPTC